MLDQNVLVGAMNWVRGNSPRAPFQRCRRFVTPLAPSRSGPKSTGSLLRCIFGTAVRRINRERKATADLALVLPTPLCKGIVHFAEYDHGEEGIIFIGREGTAHKG